MKKITLSILAIIATVSLSAQPYFVAGNGGTDSNGSFCNGINWSPRAEENEMTFTEGVYQITFPEVAAGTYDFRITTEAGWNPAWGYTDFTGTAPVTKGNENKLVFTIAQTSDITIKFDADNKKITEIVSSNGLVELVITVYTLVGSKEVFGGESDFDPSLVANDMNKSGDIWTKTYTGVAAGRYEFKVVGNHSWTAFEYPDLGPNPLLSVDEDNSTVTFTFDPATNDLDYSIEPPTGLNEGTATAVELSAANGTVYCSADKFSIYSTTGVDVTSQNGQLSGLYIIKFNNTTRTLLVK